VTPLLFISGILLGTAFSIFFGLAVVALQFFLLGTDTPRVAAEIEPLLRYSGLFLGLTLTSALGFMALAKNHNQVRWAQAVMWLSWAAAITWLVTRSS